LTGDGPAPDSAPPARPGRRRLLTLLFLAAALFSAGRFVRDRRLRRDPEELLRTARPARADSVDPAWLALETGWDLAAADAVSAMESESGGESRQRRDRARDLMLRAIAERPGWPLHRYRLALLDEPRDGGRARRTLRLAATGAPGFDRAWSALARADLDSWAALDPAERARVDEVLRRAAWDERFVASEFWRMSVALGRERSAELLPNSSNAIESAAGSLAGAGDVEGAFLLLTRAERVERREGERDLGELARLARRGDLDGVRAGCAGWFDRYPLSRLDDASGRAQLARLLALWPEDRLGSWSRDRRARIVRFFLEGRTASVPGSVLLQTLGTLSGVPDPVRARVDLLAGDVAGAEALEAARGDTSRSAEWDAYFLDLARRELSSGRLEKAGIALSRLTAGNFDDCDALFLRRDLAGRQGDRGESDRLEARLATRRAVPDDDWSSRGSLSLCIDPQGRPASRLEVAIGPGAPALIVWGWDGGRAGTVFARPEASSFEAPFSGPAGRKTLWASFLAGGTGRSLHLRLREPS
jgi:hypothetical protein